MLPVLDADLGLLTVCGFSSRLVIEDGVVVEDGAVISCFGVAHVV